MNPRLLVVFLAVAAVAAYQLDAGQPWRLLAVFAFVAVGPGLAMRPAITTVSPPITAILIVAVSLALAATTSELLAIAGVWSAGLLLYCLAAASLLGCVALPRDSR